ncbi:hypothetical protein [Sorangium sp. So ce542]|uniref:hypothetical protein n=1 Tax=Sorangium sp. So ce542 TaxID=3133316 RepID=UPI003F62E5CC
MSLFDVARPVEAGVVRQALLRADYLRRSPASVGGPGGHKEWLHFCVYGPQIDVLVNFSLCDDVRTGAAPSAELARVTVLVRGEGWDGDVDLYAPADVTVRAGHIDAAFGQSTVVFRDGEYHISAALRERPIAVDLRLRPASMPSLANNVQLDPGPPINWLVVPRLFASGTVTVAGRQTRLEGAPAYHDHNWGHFSWGRDFAWEWGFGLPHEPGCPWSLVFARLSDRAHTRAFTQALFLWKGARQHRVLRAQDLEIRHEGHLRPARILKLPRVMALLSPDLLPDVPRRLHIQGEADGDWMECVFESSDCAQVIIPNDQDLGVTIINEVSGAVRLSGLVRGETVSMEGRAIFEFLGA